MNTNRANIRVAAYREANEIWDLGKVIGLTTKQQDENMIQILVRLEERDISQSKIKIVNKEEEGVRKVN